MLLCSAFSEIKWECDGPSCYYLPTLKTPMTKAEADVLCEALGAHVAAAETKEENEYITNLAYHTCKFIQ